MAYYSILNEPNALNKMRRNAAGSAIEMIRCGFAAKSSQSAIELIRCGFAAKSSHKVLGTFTFASGRKDSFSFFCSNFHSNVSIPFYPTPRIDFGCIKDVDDAVCLFGYMVRPEPSVIDFTKLLSVIVKMKRYSVALFLFDKMHQIGAPVNEYTMTIAINCYCHLGRVDLGFALLGSFFKRGYKPNVTTYGTLIKGFFLDKNVVEAGNMFKKLVTRSICEPNEIMISTLVNGLCKAGYALTAYDLLGLLFEDVTTRKPDAYAYNTIIDCLCKEGKVEDALQLSSKMINGFCKGGYTLIAYDLLGLLLEQTAFKPDVYAYYKVIDILSKDGMAEFALRLFSKMIDKGISPDVIVYSSMIQGLCNFTRWEDVKVLLEKMVAHKIPQNKITFNIFVDSLCKKGMVKEAWEVLGIMMQRNVCPDVVTFNAMIDGYCLCGQMDEARKVFDSLEGRGLNPSIISYSSLINAYGKKGNVDEAWRLFFEALSKGLEHRTTTYNAMIHRLFCEGRFSDGWKLFDDMKARQVTPNLKTYNILVDGLCKDGKPDVALTLYNSLFPSKSLQPNVKIYTMILGSLCERGLVDEAKCLLIEMENNGCTPDAVIYTVAVRGLLRRNEFRDVMPFLDEMYRKGFSIDLAIVSMLLEQVQRRGRDGIPLEMIKKVLPNKKRLLI